MLLIKMVKKDMDKKESELPELVSGKHSTGGISRSTAEIIRLGAHQGQILMEINFSNLFEKLCMIAHFV